MKHDEMKSDDETKQEVRWQARGSTMGWAWWLVWQRRGGT